MRNKTIIYLAMIIFSACMTPHIAIMWRSAQHLDAFEKMQTIDELFQKSEVIGVYLLALLTVIALCIRKSSCFIGGLAGFMLVGLYHQFFFIFVTFLSGIANMIVVARGINSSPEEFVVNCFAILNIIIPVSLLTIALVNFIKTTRLRFAVNSTHSSLETP